MFPQTRGARGARKSIFEECIRMPSRCRRWALGGAAMELLARILTLTAGYMGCRRVGISPIYRRHSIEDKSDRPATIQKRTSYTPCFWVWFCSSVLHFHYFGKGMRPCWLVFATCVVLIATDGFPAVKAGPYLDDGEFNFERLFHLESYSCMLNSGVFLW